MNTPIHKNLKQLRLQRKLTQEQLAQRVHLTRQAISSYESGRTQPNLDTLQALADALGVDLLVLLYGPSNADPLRQWRQGAAFATVLTVFVCLFAAFFLLLPYEANAYRPSPLYLFILTAGSFCLSIAFRFALIGSIAVLLLTLASKSPIPLLCQVKWAALLMVSAHLPLLLPWDPQWNNYIQSQLHSLRLLTALLLSISLAVTLVRRQLSSAQKKDEVIS